MNKYCGYYSNLSRGKRKKQDKDDAIPSILEPEGSSKEFRKNWARLIQKIYEVDPLTCPKCSGAMKVISVIENKANLPIVSHIEKASSYHQNSGTCPHVYCYSLNSGSITTAK